MGYTVELQLGSWSTTIDQDSPQSATDAVVVLDQLRVGWRLAGDEHPAPLEPLQASLQLMALDVADLTALAVDDVAILRVLNTPGDVVASLYGRVTEVTAQQAYRSVKGADGIGVSGVWSTFNVSLVDHRAGAGVPITMTRPAESAEERFYRLSHGTGAAGEVLSPWPIRQPRALLGFVAAIYDGASLLEILDGLQSQLLSNVGGLGSGAGLPGGMYVLAPVADAVTGELALLSWHRVDYEVSTAELPLTLGVVDGQLQLVPVTGADRAIPAAQVAIDGQYRRGPENRANVVRLYDHDPAQGGDAPLTSLTYAEDYSPGDRVYMRTVIVDQLAWETDEIGWLGEALLPPGVRVGGWDREAFVWTPDSVDDVVGMFPDWSSDSYSTLEDAPSWTDEDEEAAPCFTAPVAVTGIPDNANFAGAAGVYAGVLSGAELDISGGRVAVTFSLRRQLSRPNTTVDPSSVLDYTTMRTRTTTAYRTGAVVVDPGLTHAELRLVRK